jgi:hypothetical protein
MRDLYFYFVLVFAFSLRFGVAGFGFGVGFGFGLVSVLDLVLLLLLLLLLLTNQKVLREIGLAVDTKGLHSVTDSHERLSSLVFDLKGMGCNLYYILRMIDGLSIYIYIY